MTIRAFIGVLALLLISSLSLRAQIADTVCAGVRGEVYRVSPDPTSKYYWRAECGTITSPQPADSAVIDWCDKPGVYKLSVIQMPNTGCPGDTLTVNVLVINGLNIAIDGPKVICKGETVKLTARGAQFYRWLSDQNGSIGTIGQTGSSISVRPSVTTTYTVIGYDGKCATDSAIHQISVLPSPLAHFTFSPTKPLVDEKVAFHFTGIGADELNWYFGSGDSIGGRIKDPVYVFKTPGERMVSLVARNKYGCSDTTSYRVVIDQEGRIFVPSAFSPNGDQVNDRFIPVCLGMDKLNLQVYNRWGELLYEQEGTTGGWDGTFKGVDAPIGVYLYVIKAQDSLREWHYLEGTFTLLR